MQKYILKDAGDKPDGHVPMPAPVRRNSRRGLRGAICLAVIIRGCCKM